MAIYDQKWMGIADERSLNSVSTSRALKRGRPISDIYSTVWHQLSRYLTLWFVVSCVHDVIYQLEHLSVTPLYTCATRHTRNVATVTDWRFITPGVQDRARTKRRYYGLEKERSSEMRRMYSSVPRTNTPPHSRPVVVWVKMRPGMSTCLPHVETF